MPRQHERSETDGSAFTYVDLFAGIGGFAAVLSGYGGRPVYSVEIDRAAAKVYEMNWGHSPLGDITKDANDDVMAVPAHDVLAAGFPCQPFSKSGAQRGMDETRGTLFWNILKIIEVHHPTVLVLENVRNLAGPRHIHEWQVIIEQLRAQGYRVADTPAIFSPHLLPLSEGGRPQVRERVFITATYDPDGLMDGVDPEPVVENRSRRGSEEWDLEADLPLEDDHHIDGLDLSDPEVAWLRAWDAWVRTMWGVREHEAKATGESRRRLPGFPLWVDAWRESLDPRPELETDGERDPFGLYADTPAWKVNFLRKNQAFYLQYRDVLDAWVEQHGVMGFPPSRRKLEWQAQDATTLWDCVIQLRPSGIRAKRATHVPALVAITQTSIVGPRERRLSPREAARLQGLPDSFTFGSQSASATYRQLGNGVNVGAVWHVLREHVRRDAAILKTTEAGRRILDAVVRDAPLSPDDVVESAVAAGQRRRAEHRDDA